MREVNACSRPRMPRMPAASFTLFPFLLTEGWLDSAGPYALIYSVDTAPLAPDSQLPERERVAASAANAPSVGRGNAPSAAAGSEMQAIWAVMGLAALLLVRAVEGGQPPR